MKPRALSTPASPLQPRRHQRTLPPRTSTLSALAMLVLSQAPFASAQEPAPGAKDPFVAQSAPARAEAPASADKGPTLSLTYEVFSLPIAKAGELNRRGLSDPELYQELVQTAKLERLAVLRAQSGLEVKSDSAYKHRYATQFDYHFGETTSSDGEDGAPSASGGDQKGNSAKGKPQTAKNGTPKRPVYGPTAFDFRDTGDRIVLTASVEENRLQMQIKLEHTLLLGTSKITELEVEQPQFGELKMFADTSAEFGKPRLIGTLNPWFAKSSLVPMETSRKEQDIWFCFITPHRLSDTPSGQGKAAR